MKKKKYQKKTIHNNDYSNNSNQTNFIGKKIVMSELHIITSKFFPEDFDTNFYKKNESLIIKINDIFNSLTKNNIIFLLKQYIKEDNIFSEVLNDLQSKDQILKHIRKFNYLFKTSTLNTREIQDDLIDKIPFENDEIFNVIMNYKTKENKLNLDVVNKDLFFNDLNDKRRRLMTDSCSKFYFA